jgi:phospholipase C
MALDEAAEQLRSIKHIVVLMMENRSFDHMLGYLGLPGGIDGVDGLQHATANFDADGNTYPPLELGRDKTSFKHPGKSYDQSLDPCHGPECVAEQLEEFHGVKPGGFVKNFIAEKRPDPDWRGLPMGYYTEECLPVYDFLARQFCVCDAWHSSIPGDTWPNRLYSLAGRVGPKVHFGLLEQLAALITGKKPNVPIYEVEAFTRHLRDEQWRWYSHDPATLRAADKLYRTFQRRRQNFAYFNRKRVSDITQALEAPIVAHDSFLDDAAKHQLRDVSWIDPNFIDLHVFDVVSDDDHPPSDVLAGQALVLELYHALTKTADWDDTLLVVCYDEHGGFYDHVSPPAVDDEPRFRTYGVRVPALVIGPRVKQEVCSRLFDHTTLIKTILTRFAPDPERSLASMPARVRNASHLGGVLQSEPRRDLASHHHLHDVIDDWRNGARAERRASGDAAESSHLSKAPDGAGHPLRPNDFQVEFARLAGALRKKGLPPGQP